MQVTNPSELLSGLKMQQFLEILEKKFSKIIIDTPPIDIIPDALILNKYIHNIILVVRYNKTKKNKITNKIKEYSTIKNDIKGIIINASAEVETEKYQSYSYYHY